MQNRPLHPFSPVTTWSFDELATWRAWRPPGTRGVRTAGSVPWISLLRLIDERALERFLSQVMARCDPIKTLNTVSIFLDSAERNGK